MFRSSNPRWTRLLALATVLLTTFASAAFAGNTHTEGGAVAEAPGVPETDGTTTVQIYWTGDSAARTSIATGATLAGYWLHDVGFALTRPWLVGDEHVAVLEHQTGAGTAAHVGYYGVSTKLLTSYDPDEFPAMTVRAIPVPIAAAGPGRIDLHWSPATSAGGPNGIAGYNLYRSTDGIAFAKLNATVLADTVYQDASAAFGTTYQYALGLVYGGTPAFEGAALSASSAPVTPADATPPDAPTIASEPAWSPGTTNTLSWSSEAATGATAYLAECALDPAFGTLVGSSGWQADSTWSASGLTDGLTYYYRVRSRDAAANASAFSPAASSRQDASAPASNLLALTAFKASSTVNLEWTASDSLSGVAGVQLWYAKDGAPFVLYAGGPFTSSPIAFDAATTGGDGAYAFYTLANDAVANAEGAPETPDATTIIDTQAPTIPALAGMPAFTAGLDRNLSWSSAAASGAATYAAQASLTDDFAAIAAESGWIADSTHTFAGLEDGQRYAYRVRSRDAAGNESDWSALAASTQDASGPATAAAALPAATNAAALQIAWTGADAGSGLAGIELYWSKDGAPFAALAGGPFTTSPIAFDAAAMGGDGAYAFYTLGTDALGNAEAAPATPDAQIAIDTQAPDAPALAALPAYTPGSTRTVQWDATGAAASQAQAATDAAFTAIAHDSDWITEATFTFDSLADGQLYFYRLRTRDAAGNASAWSATRSSTQDASAPATAVAALPPLTSTASFAIAWTGTDAGSGLASVALYFSKDGGAWAPYAGGPFASSPIAFDAATTGGDGSYRFHTRGSDAAGNEEAAPAEHDAETLIDTSAPGAPTIAGLQNFTAGNTVQLGWSDESATGAAEYLAEMSTDDFATVAATSGWTANRTHSFTALANGTSYAFRVKARDSAQNETGYSGLQSTTMDATAPIAALEALPLSGNDPQLSLAWAGFDATSGLLDVDLYWSKDGGAYALAAGAPFTSSPIAFDATSTGDGLYRFYLRGRDRAGNLEAAPASAEASMLIDTAAPAAPEIASLPAFTSGTERMLSWSDQAASGATAYRAEAAADAGFTTLLGTSDWIAATSTTFTGLADGQTVHYRVQSRDAVGNTSSFSPSLASTQDAAAPQTQIAALAPTSASALVSLAWTGSDATSGISGIDLYWSKDGAPFALHPASPFAVSPIGFDANAFGGDGSYAFYSIGRDAVGNLETAPASPDAATTIDTAAPPAPQITALPGYSPGTALTLLWEDMGSGATYHAQMSASAGFGAILQDTGWIAATGFAFTGLQDGQTYHFRVQARDAALNPSAFSSPTSTTMDATAPSSQLAALPALVNSTALALDWSGFDLASGIAGVDLYYSRNGGAFSLDPASPFAGSPIAFDAATKGGDGQYAFYIRARDAAGNLESVPAAPDASTRIDATAPNVPALAALPQFSPGSAVLVSWSSQAASGAIEYRAEMASDAGFGSILAASGWIAATSWSFASLDDGARYFFRVKTRDAALNESAYAAPQNTTLDDTPPASSVSPLASVTTTLSFGIAWSGSDATSGVASVDLYYARDGGAYTLYPGGPYAASPIVFDALASGGQGSYAFYARARDRVGNREPAPGGPDAQTIVNTSAVGTPTLAALPAYTPGTSRALNWTAGGNDSSWLVQAATDAGFAAIAAQSGWITSLSHTFNGLTDGQTYWYRVKGRNALAIEGSWSPALSSRQDATPPSSQLAALSAQTADPTIDLAWSGSDAASGIAGVLLYVSRNGGAYAEYPGGLYTINPIAFDATTLGGDGSYGFYTRGVDAAGNIESAPASADASTIIDTTAPGAPVLAGEPGATQGTSNTVAWGTVGGASEYWVDCALDAAFLAIHSSSGWTPATSWNFTGLEVSTTYWYRVRARDALGNVSAWSAAVSSTQSAGTILGAGWNLISFNVDPTDPRIDHVLAPIAGSFTIVRGYQSGAFATYLPSLPLDMNDLQSMNAKLGYWIYMTRPDTLAVAGNPVSPGTPIDLAAGWNLAGYLPSAPLPPANALATIAGSYALARGYEAGAGYRTHYPGLPGLSDLLEMRTGQGYWLYMTAPDQLVYGGLPKTQTVEPGAKLPIAIASDATSVPTVMDLYSTEFTIDGAPAPVGTVVEARDAADRLLGSATVAREGVLPVLHLLGDVSITEADEGLQGGETFTLRVRDRDLTQLGDAELAWEANAARSTKLEFVATESLLPKSFALGQNVPNPFNPTTTVSYAIPSRVNGAALVSTAVDLRVFDIRGRVVKTLVRERQAPGRYDVRWDGRDESGRSVAAGVYFYRLQTNEFTQSKKMLMVK